MAVIVPMCQKCNLWHDHVFSCSCSYNLHANVSSQMSLGLRITIIMQVSASNSSGPCCTIGCLYRPAVPAVLIQTCVKANKVRQSQPNHAEVKQHISSACDDLHQCMNMLWPLFSYVSSITMPQATCFLSMCIFSN